VKKLLFGIAALPFLATAATADPLQLSSKQMDQVTAGWSIVEFDWFNSGMSGVAVYPRTPGFDAVQNAVCASVQCVVNIHTPTISLFSWKPEHQGETWPISPPFVPTP
jgi:hypothetical protein